MWRAFVSLLGALATFWPGLVWAAAPPVHLEVEQCQSLDARDIQRIFSADLGTATTSETGPEVTEVTIACEGELVTVRVRDPLSRKTLKRSFDPKSFGSQAESRIIAIAASELVLASWAELAANPKPKVSPEGPAPSAAAVETARGVVQARRLSAPTPGTTAPPAPPSPPPPSSSELPPDDEPAAGQPAIRPHERGPTPTTSSPTVFDRATAVVSFRYVPNGNGTLWGGGARFGREHYSVVSWAVDALIENGVLSDQKVTSSTLGGWICFYAHAGPTTFRLGGGLRAGALSRDEGVTVAMWGWPMGVASQTIRFRSLVIEFSGEGGIANLLLRNGTPGLQGGWVSGQVGLGIAL